MLLRPPYSAEPDAVMPAPLLLDDGTAPWQKHDVYAPGLQSGWIDLTITRGHSGTAVEMLDKQGAVEIVVRH